MAEPHPVPVVLSADDLDPLHLEALLGGSVVATADTAVIEVSGTAAVDCLQGLVTADLKGAGDGSFVYAAVLTPKGMILSDMWIAQRGNRAWITLPDSGRRPLLEAFKKYLPPRLATVSDRTKDFVTLRVAGPRSLAAARNAGIDVPNDGQATVTIAGGSEGTVARPTGEAAFTIQVRAPRDEAESVLAPLQDAGATVVAPAVLEAARILAGWPDFGAEIDGKTLPQEVRFDEHGGISYTKGCYTGQETVARLHFRGHANRELVGLSWEADAPDPSDHRITQDDMTVGRVSSLAWIAPFSQWLGLGVLHRKADRGAAVAASGAAAFAIPLPMNPGL